MSWASWAITKDMQHRLIYITDEEYDALEQGVPACLDSLAAVDALIADLLRASKELWG